MSINHEHESNLTQIGNSRVLKQSTHHMKMSRYVNKPVWNNHVISINSCYAIAHAQIFGSVLDRLIVKPRKGALATPTCCRQESVNWDLFSLCSWCDSFSCAVSFLYTLVSIPALAVTFLSHRAIVLVDIGLWGFWQPISNWSVSPLRGDVLSIYACRCCTTHRFWSGLYSKNSIWRRCLPGRVVFRGVSIRNTFVCS